MMTVVFNPTPFQELNEVLLHLVSHAKGILQENLRLETSASIQIAILSS